ncbi:hypothetical protein EPUS_09060 [Endocarpon pusillum Z07020]|uniref:CFEM domain-containing protein n=1 Tax=Endocarpon pusillum (strain Z07020 / HMAS-L-300199) TaxID=1263415 RepID=U1HLG0_ENDPU|nr:uncharacterized protein EPUS_09060 [Endocarpon pusillum Z07020]ERF69844.1 hypothetical protein EPUS_09060 [Endocarpon pusillum Z07020]
MVSMRFASIATLAASLVAVSAQDFSSIPQCAQSCAINAIPQECNLRPDCICRATSFLEGIGCCVIQACSQEDVDRTAQFSEQLCRTAGVTDLPTPSCPESGSSNGTGAGSSNSSSTANASATASGASSSASGASTAAASATGLANSLMAQGMGVLGAAVFGAVALM